MKKPLLIVVTGCPGSGKTTLAHTLARKIGCPTICRDEIKEGFVNTMQSSHESLGKDVNQGIYATFFEILDFLLSKQITLVAEAAFQHNLWVAPLERLLQTSQIKIVVCTVDPHLARTRFIQRGLSDPNRLRFHGDWGVRAAQKGIELPLGNYEPPLLPIPTLEVDTSDGYRPNLNDIESFLLKGL
ncbi:MAG: ATP-binding protein [Chroococcus sp. CMT-3BRIN-NPC107]|jgi:predicted kinase|nr:ATP-binding protein [Chroococcus sp. CMT-3BRIN-NPC107]